MSGGIGSRAEFAGPVEQSRDDSLFRLARGPESFFCDPAAKHGAEGVEGNLGSFLPVSPFLGSLHVGGVKIVMAVAADHLGELSFELLRGEGLNADGEVLGCMVAVLGHNTRAGRTVAGLQRFSIPVRPQERSHTTYRASEVFNVK